VKLIGAGLPRTGTLSQKIALEMLGFGPCYHMVTVLADLSQADLWNRAIAGDAPWSEIFDGYQATVDWPGGFFYKELIEVYPEAMVLLSERDPEEWERSMRQTVWEVRNGESLMRKLSDAQGLVHPPWQSFLTMVDGVLWKGHGTFAGAHAQDGQLAEGMARHHEAVKRTVPPERLLTWSVSEGWDPLCEFLHVPTPDSPFPRVNDSQAFVDRVIDGSLAMLNAWRSQTAAGAASAATP
jgi:Sulfotransferase domain